MRREALVGLMAASCASALAAASVLGTARQPTPVSIERGLPAWLLALGLVALATIVVSAWFAAGTHPSSTVGLAVACSGLVIPLLAGWSGLPNGARAAAVAASPLTVAGAGHVALRWADPRHRRWALVGVYVLAGGAVLVHAGGYDPLTDPGCLRVCADVDPVAGSLLDTRTAIVTAALITVVAALVAAGAVWSVRPPRSLGTGTLAALGLLAVSQVMRVESFADHTISAERVVLLPWMAATLLGATALHELASARRSRWALNRLVAQLADPERAWANAGGAVRAVHFAVPGEGRWVDGSGRDVPTTESTAAVVLSDAHGPAVRLTLGRGRTAGDVLAVLTPAGSLALTNAQLAAAARARVADVRASHRRVVAASDGERLRIERDLHDGAQQRLVSAMFHLSVARSRAGAEADALDSAEASVRTVLAQLRTMSHGIFPSVLASEGLEAALEELSVSSDVPIALEVSGVDGLDAETAMAAYAAVRSAVDHATISDGPAAVSLVRHDALLIVRIETDGPGPSPAALIEVADRVSALGGRLATSSNVGRTELTAELPCG